MSGRQINESVEKPFRLTAIRFSHYVEKVRWTMDRLGIPYLERPLMPMVHFMVTPFVTGLSGHADEHSTRFSTPVIKTDRNEVIVKSSAIMCYLSERCLSEDETLFPTEEVVQLDEHYNRYLGPHTRRLFYFNVLNQPDLMFELADRNVGAGQAWLFKTLYRSFRRWIRSGLGITRERVDKGIGHIYKEFDRVAQTLSDGRPYLFGDRLTAADISFACLGGAAMLPTPAEGYGAYLPPLDRCSDELRRVSTELRESDAGKWVLGLYRAERGKRVIPALPSLS